MYPIDASVAALFDANQVQTLRITGTDANGAAINITGNDVMIGSFSIDRYCCNGNRLEIGTAVAAQMTCRLNNSTGKFNGIRFEGAELFVEIGIADWSLDDPVITYIPCGYFIPDEQPRMKNIISLTALDRMMYFDAIPPTLSPWTNENGEKIRDNNGDLLYFVADIVLPCTLQNLIEQTCARCSVPFTQNISSLPNSGYTISEIPKLHVNVTFRNLIQWAAALMGTNAFIDWTGSLRFAWFGDTGYNSTMDRRYASDMQENDITVTGVKYTVEGEETTTYIAGSDVYAFDLSSNALIGESTNISTLLLNLYTPLANFTYRPFEATVKPAPWLFPMDRVTFTDSNGTGHVSILTNVNFGVNGHTILASRGETSQMNGYVPPSGLTTQQQQALNRVQKVTLDAVQEAVESATAEITGASESHVRFMYDSSGGLQEILIMDTDDITTAVNVWRWNSGGLGFSHNGYSGPYTTAITQSGSIVANFITTGVLSANLIRAGVMVGENGGTMFDLNNGIIVAASGTQIIHIEDGEIGFYFERPDPYPMEYIGDMRVGDELVLYYPEEEEDPVLLGTIEINSHGYIDLRSMVDDNGDVTADTARLYLYAQDGVSYADVSADKVTLAATDLALDISGDLYVNSSVAYTGTIVVDNTAIGVRNGIIMYVN